MRGRMWFLAGAAVGFVLGARAGREKYEQLMQAARRLWEHPTTQETAGVVQEQASKLIARGKEMVGDRFGMGGPGRRTMGAGGMEQPPDVAPVSEDVAVGMERRGPGPR